MAFDVQSGQPEIQTNPSDTAASSPSRSRSPGPLVFGAAGLAGGLAAASLIQAFFPIFEVPAELLPVGTPSPEQLARADRAQFRVDCLNGSVAGALYGALAGLLIGFIATRKSKSTGGALGSGLLVALAAIVVGIFAGYLMPYVRAAMGPGTVDTDLWFTVAVQAFFLGTVGLAIGVALSIVSRSEGAFSQRIFGGLIGGVIAGAVYPIAAAFLFADAHTEGAVPREAALQFLWLGAGGLLTGLSLAGSSPPRKTSTVASASPADAAS